VTSPRASPGCASRFRAEVAAPARDATTVTGAHRPFAWAEPSCHPPSVSTSADFEAAQARVKTLTSTPSPDELLELYALFKQGTQGDVTGSRPGMLDFKGRAKFDAWEKKKGLARDAAQKAYVELVAKLEARYGKA
jgi:diazepam-binding inhibitor (GABA receptor modulator, acyl-CoA-binding protein)